MTDNSKSDQNIRVIIRVKGHTLEDSREKSSHIKVINNNSIIIESKNKSYYFDYVGDENTTQNDIFEQCGKKICDYSLEGYNGTIFAYGQTGSGKTYTLLGKNITNTIKNKNNNINNTSNIKKIESEDIEMKDDSNLNDSISEFTYDQNDENIGLFPRILYYLFKNSSKCKNEENKFLFKISYLEIYRDNIIDLLHTDNKEKVQLSDINGVLYLKNLRILKISSPEEAIKYIIDGNQFRHSASTLMNEESSRSHAIISIYIENNLLKVNKIKKSVFHIIDLAGSERQQKTGTTGDRTKEAGSINKSLLNLSIVINNIIKNIKQIPYRDSILTHILRDSLGGNAKTSIIATISKLDRNLDETKCTLAFAQNAKKIKNNAIINEELSGNSKNWKEKYLLIFKELSDLKKQYQKERNSINKRESMSKSFEAQNEEINTMMKDILEKEENLNKLKEENDNLKDKIEKDDIELQLKNIEIKEMKQIISDINDKNSILSNENKNLKNEINTLEEKLKSIEESNKNLEEKNKNKFHQMEENFKNLQSSNVKYDEIINKLKENIKSYEEQIKILDNNLDNSKKIIEYKEKDINNLNEIITTKENKIRELNEIIDKYMGEIKEMNNKLNETNKNNEEIKDKGKEIIKKYDEAIIRFKETINKNKDEIKSLKQAILENEKKMNNINETIKSLEEVKELINNKFKNADKINRDNIEIISSLHQEIIKLEAEKKEILKEKEEIIRKSKKLYGPGYNSNINPISNGCRTQMITKNNIENNAKYIKLKYEYDKINSNYQDLIKTLDPKNENGSGKIRTIEDMCDKINNLEKNIEDYKNTIKEGIRKLYKILEVNDDKDNKNFKIKFELVVQSVIDCINKKNVQIGQLNDEKEILLQEIRANHLKKNLFDILKAKNDGKNKEDIINNHLNGRIKKLREKDCSKKINSKIKEKYLKDLDLMNDENNNVSNYNRFQGINQNNITFNESSKYTQ